MPDRVGVGLPAVALGPDEVGAEAGQLRPGCATSDAGFTSLGRHWDVRIPGNDLGMSYFSLQEDLEELFGRPVDLVPKEGLHRVIRDKVLADAQVLYAA